MVPHSRLTRVLQDFAELLRMNMARERQEEGEEAWSNLPDDLSTELDT